MWVLPKKGDYNIEREKPKRKFQNSKIEGYLENSHEFENLKGVL